MTTMEWVRAKKIIAIVRGLQPDYMLRLADALYAGGIDLMEVTFNQKQPETWQDTAAAVQGSQLAALFLQGHLPQKVLGPVFNRS